MFKLSKDDKTRFVWKWVLSTAIAWLVGLAAPIVLHYAVLNRFYGEETTNLWAGLFLGGSVGFAQWMVLKKHVKLGLWWIFACAIGMGLPFMAAVYFKSSIVNIPPLVEMAAVPFVGGILCGLLQVKAIQSISPRYILWIILSAFAWMISFFAGIAGGVLFGLTTGLALLRVFNLPLQPIADSET